jgi:hypothetical protein
VVQTWWKYFVRELRMLVPPLPVSTDVVSVKKLASPLSRLLFMESRVPAPSEEPQAVVYSASVATPAPTRLVFMALEQMKDSASGSTVDVKFKV